MTRPSTRVGLVAVALTALASGSSDAQRAVRVERGPIAWIPAGSFTMGASSADLFAAIHLCQQEHDLTTAEGCSEERFAHEMPARRVDVPLFAIDRTEVPRGRYRRCVLEGRCAPSRDRAPDGDDDAELPVAGITWDEARRYCEWAGGRLPTEQEWEKAARGDARNRFPWGRAYHPRLANHGRPPFRPDASDGYRHASPVGAFADGASPYGVLDMAGNVWEWTSSVPTTRDFDSLGAAQVDPSPYRTIRGGSWSHPASAMRVTSRSFLLVGEAPADVGVRCAYDAR